MIMVIYTARKLWQESTGAKVDKFCVIRSHISSRSQFLKHRSRVGVKKFRLRTPLIRLASKF